MSVITTIQPQNGRRAYHAATQHSSAPCNRNASDISKSYDISNAYLKGSYYMRFGFHRHGHHGHHHGMAHGWNGDHGHDHRGSPGFGGRFGGRGRGGRFFDQGDLRLVILAMLAEQPR